MGQKIEKDLSRFQKKKKAVVKSNLKNLIKEDAIIVKQGKKYVSIPITKLNIPHFKFGENRSGEGKGAGQGPQAGDEPGRHLRETDVSLEELAEMLGEELELPRIEPKGANIMKEEKDRYTGVRIVGPESLRLNRRTYKESLKRQLSCGNYDYDNPIIVPIKQDKRYRSWKTIMEPQNNAVIIYGMDVSASMGTQHKALARQVAFWIDLWLNYNHPGLEKAYIMHDTRAWEVDQEAFYHTTTGGGTKISSYFEKAREIIEKKYKPEDWNIYLLYFSDGDNLGEDDSACDRLIELLLDKVNLIGYGQLDLPTYYSSSSDFYNHIAGLYANNPKVVTNRLKDNADIIPTLQAFFRRSKDNEQ